MPIVVGPSVPVSGPPVTSGDGILTATPRYDLGAVLLKVQFGSAAVDARTVSVIRGDGSRVRGLDACPAPSGVTAGIDAEVALGSPVTYYATAVKADGTVFTSQAVSLTVPRPPNKAWWGCLSRPTLSLLVTVLSNGYPDWPLTGRVGAFSPLSSPYTSTAIGVPAFGQGSARVMTYTAAEAAAFQALVSQQEPLLLRPDALQAQARPDDYMTVMSATPTQPADARPDVRIWNLNLVRNLRPDTDGSTVVIPGRTIGDLLAAYPTIGALPVPALRWLTG